MRPLPEDFLAGLNFLSREDSSMLISALQSSNPASSIRLNRVKLNQPPFPAFDVVLWCPDGFYLNERPLFAADPLYHAGTYYAQEAGSMFIDFVLRNLKLPAGRISALDMCAAPGGKSLILCSYFKDSGFVVANEPVSNRNAVLRENLAKWGLANYMTTKAEAKQFEKLKSSFDIVLADAPCSGEGMFRKDETAIEEWSLKNVQQCMDRQVEIVRAAFHCLKPGGYLIYTTCTFNRSENELQLSAYLNSAKCESIRFNIPADWNIRSSDFEGVTSYRFLPGICRSEGFTVSVLKKNESDVEFDNPHHKHNKPNAWKRITLKDYLTREFQYYELPNGEMFALRKEDLPMAERVYNSMHISNLGTDIGCIKNGKLIPSASLAFSCYLNKECFKTIDVSLRDALLFLQKGDLKLKAEKDLYLLTYQSQALGFINHLGNRINNLYPAEWRLRKDFASQVSSDTAAE